MFQPNDRTNLEPNHGRHGAAGNLKGLGGEQEQPRQHNVNTRGMGEEKTHTWHRAPLDRTEADQSILWSARFNKNLSSSPDA